MKQSTPDKPGDPFISNLTILFIALKLCGVIDWSWWWVLSPLIGLCAFAAVVAAVVVAAELKKR